MRRSEKPFVVQDLAARIRDAKSLVVLDYQGLAVRELSGLRRKIKEVGGHFIVAKNTLLKLALSESRVTSDKSTIKDQLVGPTAIVFAEQEELAPLQILGKLLAEPKFKFGIFGQDLFDAEKLLRLSRLPGREVLLGQLASLAAGPAYNLVGTLQGNLGKLVHLLNTKAKGGE